MAIALQILGREGTGKTFSLKFLNPKNTFYINADKKSMPFKGWRKAYNQENKNYLKSSDASRITRAIQSIATNLNHINVIVVDTVNSIMSDKEMSERKKPGYDKWQDLAGSIYDMYSLANSEDLREDLIVVFIGHVEPYQDNFNTCWRLKTNGQKLTKLNVEGKLTYTLYSQVEVEGEDLKYSFVTQTDGTTTARTPEGLFDRFIPNNLKLVTDMIREYENAEFELEG